MTNSIITVTITYERPGTTPPIFVAGSFTEPPWQPIELDHRQVNEEYVFSKIFDITLGKHQYKFRVGHGDWWACDDTKDKEIDEAGNVNNVMTVQSFGTSNLGQLVGESSDFDRGAEPSTKTASENCKSTSLGLDGVDDSDEELARSLRKEVALTENTMADFHGANGDIEPDDPKPEMARRDDSKTHDASNALINGSVTTSKQGPSIDKAPAPESRAGNPSTASEASAETSQRPTHNKTEDQDGEEKLLSKKPSVSTISTKNGPKDQGGFWLIKVCRVVVQGVVGSMSTLLCGKRRKLLAVALTALIIPVLAWSWRS